LTSSSSSLVCTRSRVSSKAPPPPPPLGWQADENLDLQSPSNTLRGECSRHVLLKLKDSLSASTQCERLHRSSVPLGSHPLHELFRRSFSLRPVGSPGPCRETRITKGAGKLPAVISMLALGSGTCCPSRRPPGYSSLLELDPLVQTLIHAIAVHVVVGPRVPIHGNPRGVRLRVARKLRWVTRTLPRRSSAVSPLPGTAPRRDTGAWGK
jgi:hypothetical protein